MLKMRLCFFEVGCTIEQVFNIAAFCFLFVSVWAKTAAQLLVTEMFKHFCDIQLLKQQPCRIKKKTCSAYKVVALVTGCSKNVAW